ncbi:hypothetical protein DSH97_00005, partial [Enterococcus faecium]|nr:hypothetical protein [Enterococcus faecium]
KSFFRFRFSKSFSNSFIITYRLLFVKNFFEVFSIESSFTSGSFLTTQLSYHVISNMSTTYFLLFNKLLVFF